MISQTPKAIIVATALAIGVLAVLTAFNIDISAVRLVRLDAAVRDAFPESDLPQIRFGDPSSALVWAPADHFLWTSLRSGKLPLWDRSQAGGYSPIIAFYLGALHPLRWLCVLAPRAMMPNALIVLSLYFAALGVFLLARSFQLEAVPATVAAVLYAIGPATISSAHYSGHLLPLAHLPWILLFYRKHLARRDRASFCVLVILLGLLFICGHPSIEFGVCFTVLLVAIFDTFYLRSARPLLALGAAAAIAALVAAFALLPPLLALPDMWSYKTATLEGISYRPLTLKAWLGVLTMMGRDRMEYVFPDQPVSYAYVSAPVLVLVALLVFAWRGRSRDMTVALVMLGVWFLLAVPGPWMTPLQRVPPFRFMTPWYLSGFFGFWTAIAAASGFAQLWRKPGVPRLTAMALAFLAGALYLARTYLVLDPAPWRPPVGDRVLAALQSNSQPFRVTGTFGQVHAANISAITGIEDIRFLAPMFPLRYERWWTLVDPDAIRRAYAPVRITDRLESPLIGDFNIAYVLQARFPPTDTFWTIPDPASHDRFLSSRLVPPRFPVILHTPSLLVHLNRASEVRQRAHFAPQVVRVDDLDGAVRTLTADPALPLRAAVVEHRRPLILPPLAQGMAKVVYPDHAHAIVDVQSITGGLLVLHDAYANGWTATIDGQETQIMPVNVLSRGVVVPAGAHRIAFSYFPPGLKLGSMISLLAVMGLCAFVIAARPWRPVDEGTPITALGEKGSSLS